MIQKKTIKLPSSGIRGLIWEHILCAAMSFLVGLKLNDFWWGLGTFLFLEFIAIQFEKTEWDLTVVKTDEKEIKA